MSVACLCNLQVNPGSQRVMYTTWCTERFSDVVATDLSGRPGVEDSGAENESVSIVSAGGILSLIHI